MQAIAQEYNRQGSNLVCDVFHASKSRAGAGGLMLVGFGKVDERKMKGDWRSGETIHARALRGGWCCCRCRFYCNQGSESVGSLCTRTTSILLPIGEDRKQRFKAKRLCCSRRVCLREGISSRGCSLKRSSRKESIQLRAHRLVRSMKHGTGCLDTYAATACLVMP